MEARVSGFVVLDLYDAPIAIAIACRSCWEWALEVVMPKRVALSVVFTETTPASFRCT